MPHFKLRLNDTSHATTSSICQLIGYGILNVYPCFRHDRSKNSLSFQMSNRLVNLTWTAQFVCKPYLHVTHLGNGMNIWVFCVGMSQNAYLSVIILESFYECFVYGYTKSLLGLFQWFILLGATVLVIIEIWLRQHKMGGKKIWYINIDYNLCVRPMTVCLYSIFRI